MLITMIGIQHPCRQDSTGCADRLLKMAQDNRTQLAALEFVFKIRVGREKWWDIVI